MSAIGSNTLQEIRAVQIEEDHSVNKTAKSLERGKVLPEQNNTRWSFTWPKRKDERGLLLMMGASCMIMGLCHHNRPGLSMIAIDPSEKMGSIFCGAVFLFDALCAGTNIVVDGNPDWKGISKVSLVAIGTLALSYACWNS